MFIVSITKATYPVTVALGRSRMKLEDDYPDDDELEGLLKGAVEDVEGRTGAYIARGVLTYNIHETSLGSSWPIRIRGMNPAITEISYVPAGGGDQVTVDLRTLTLDRVGPTLRALYYPPSEGWPQIETSTRVKITASIGFTKTGIPKDLQSAVYLQARQMHDGDDFNRERSIRRLLYRYTEII